MAGRRSQRTEETAVKIIEGITVGLTYRFAAAYGGISHDTLSRWRKADASFAERIAAAEARGVVANLARIQQGAQDGDWRAAAWILEHRHPGDYGKTVNEFTGKDGGPIRHEVEPRTYDYSALSLREQFDFDQMLAKIQEAAVVAK